MIPRPQRSTRTVTRFPYTTRFRSAQFAIGEQPEPLFQGFLGIVAVKVVARIEQALSARLPLAARERAKAVEPARDRRDEAKFAPAIGRHRQEKRRGRLMRAVRAAKPLDCGVSTPARPEETVVATGLVLARQHRVIAAAGAAIGKE